MEAMMPSDEFIYVGYFSKKNMTWLSGWWFGNVWNMAVIVHFIKKRCHPFD